MVIINEKMCDNAKECSGIMVCPTGAIFWNEAEGKIDVDNELCVSCGKCVNEEGCPVGAIRVVDNKEDYDNEKARIMADERTVEDLFVERYGASVIEEDLLIEPSNIERVLRDGKYTFIEQFNDDSIQCLLHSIPISEIREGLDIEFDYYKCDVGLSEVSSLYPVLVIFYDKKYLGKVEGYYEDKKKKELIDEIVKITNAK